MGGLDNRSSIRHDLAQKADDVIRIVVLMFIFALPSHHAQHACSFHTSTSLLTARRTVYVFSLIRPSHVSVAAYYWSEDVRLPHRWHHWRGSVLLLQLLLCHFEWGCGQKRLHRGCKSTRRHFTLEAKLPKLIKRVIRCDACLITFPLYRTPVC